MKDGKKRTINNIRPHVDVDKEKRDSIACDVIVACDADTYTNETQANLFFLLINIDLSISIAEKINRSM